MTKHSLRPIAICVMLSGLPLLAPQDLSAQVATVNQVSFGTVEGKALDASGKAVKNTTVRLRDVRTAQIVDTKQTDNSGTFVFKNIEPGNYVVELVQNGQVLAASGMLTVNSGEGLMTTIVVAGSKSGTSILGMSIPVAAIVMGSAAAAGVLAVQSGDCVSPPCQ